MTVIPVGPKDSNCECKEDCCPTPDFLYACGIDCKTYCNDNQQKVEAAQRAYVEEMMGQNISDSAFNEIEEAAIAKRQEEDVSSDNKATT